MEKTAFGRTAGGEAVSLYTIRSGACSVGILDYGCTLQFLSVPDCKGRSTDVCLGYDTMAEYEQNGGYVGGVIGRYANRIGRGRFTLNGKDYTLAVNDGANHLHGGLRGFDKYVWDAKYGDSFVKFSRISPDGEEGYPGTLAVSVTYTLTSDGVLRLQYRAESDADTVLNLTNHCYFNLNGQGSGTVLGHTLQMASCAFTENDAGCLPTGNILSVDGTPFDFRSAKALGRDIGLDDVQLKNGCGYDHNFIIFGTGLRESAVLCGERSGIRLRILTDQPGIQLYSANFLSQRIGKGGTQYHPRDAVCLETQHYPNSLAYPSFPSVVLKKGERFFTESAFCFDCV